MTETPAPLEIGYPIVVTDLDGTIVGWDLTMSPLVRDVFRRLLASGTRVILNTGRMVSATLPHADALDLDGPLIAYHGALISDIVTGSHLLHRPVPREVAREILADLEPKGWELHVYIDDVLHVKELTPRMERYQASFEVVIKRVGPLASFLDTDPTKLMVAGRPEDLAALAPRLRDSYGHAVNITVSLPFLIDIGHPEASKGAALAFLAEREGFTAADVIAFGDSEGDIDMLRWAGSGVAVGNAPEAVKAVADQVCGPVEDDGVARYLLRLAGEGR